MIVSNPKARDVRAKGGDDSPILLIPELCTRTGEGGREGWRGEEAQLAGVKYM